jgi:hypothetical protein
MTTMSSRPVSGADRASPSGGDPTFLKPGTSQSKPTYIDRFRALSSVYQWAIAIAAALLLYVAADDGVWAPARDLNAKSDRLATALKEGAQRDALLKSVSGAIMPIGRIVVPRAETNGSQELRQSINEVMKNFGVSPEMQGGIGANMTAPPELQDLIAVNNRLSKVTQDLTFSAKQEVVAKVLAALEARPEIESISSLKLTRDAKNQRVDVMMTVEAWVQVPKKVRAGVSP